MCHYYAPERLDNEPVCVGQCLPRHYVCDGIADCENNDDEIGCGKV